eukprot:439937_1
MTSRIEPFMEQTAVRAKMQSVKQVKAVWYQGINKHHEIYSNQPMTKDHVLALILYTQCTKLCTLYRETYRQSHDEESEQQLVLRHAEYANMGRLLYESFVFFASTNSQVQLLYHGMSIPLLFRSLFCTFDAPTSTTTASNVATNFGETGIVIKFESSESTKYIRTLDMGSFTCYHNEEEHLIFETRLHIKDIFIPRSKLWIGSKLMKRLSLFDLLIHG